MHGSCRFYSASPGGCAWVRWKLFDDSAGRPGWHRNAVGQRIRRGLGILVRGQRTLLVAGGGSSFRFTWRWTELCLATNAVLSGMPTGVAMDGVGNLYIADGAQKTGSGWSAAEPNERDYQGVLRARCAGIISTIAGGGTATARTLNNPTSCGSGWRGESLHRRHTGNNAIRKIAAVGDSGDVNGCRHRESTGFRAVEGLPMPRN